MDETETKFCSFCLITCLTSMEKDVGGEILRQGLLVLCIRFLNCGK